MRSELLRRHVVRSRVAPPCSQMSSVRWHLAHSVTTAIADILTQWQCSGCVVRLISALLCCPYKFPSLNTSGNVHVSAELPNLCTSPSSSLQCNDHKTLQPLLCLCCMVAAQGTPALALVKTHMKTGLRNYGTFW